MPNLYTAFRTAFTASLCSLVLLDRAASWSFRSALCSRGVRALLQTGIEQYGQPPFLRRRLICIYYSVITYLRIRNSRILLRHSMERSL